MKVLRYISLIVLITVALSNIAWATDTTSVLGSEPNKKAETYLQLATEYEKQGDYRRADSAFSVY